MSSDSSSSLIWATTIMPMSCEFMAVHPQHSSFYPITSRSSSRGSSLSSPTFPGVQLTHFSSPSQLPIPWLSPNTGAPRQPRTHLALPRQVCSFEAQTVPPRCPPMLFPMLKKSLEENFGSNPCRHEHIPLANFSRRPPAARAPEPWQWIRTGRWCSSSVPLPLTGCQAPAVPSDLPLLQLTNQMNQQPQV